MSSAPAQPRERECLPRPAADSLCVLAQSIHLSGLTLSIWKMKRWSRQVGKVFPDWGILILCEHFSGLLNYALLHPERANSVQEMNNTHCLTF